jgi:hypothetical protein
MTVALLSMDEAISGALLKPHQHDRLATILDAIADHPATQMYRQSRLEEIIEYAMRQAERRGRPDDGILVEQIIFNFLEEFDDR